MFDGVKKLPHLAWPEKKFFYADHQEVPLPVSHRFPMQKYSMLREALIKEGILQTSQLLKATPLNEEYLYLAHTQDYVQDVLNLRLDPLKARPIGLPLSHEMVLRARTSAGAFFEALHESLKTGYSASLAGGTHHAHADRGEGFCFFNDFAIGVRWMAQQFVQKKILILDLDVHQGNGNASILKNDPNVYLISFHGKHNYPYRKVDSHVDVAFENGTGDDEYLTRLDQELRKLDLLYPMDHLFYQAGVDSLEGDRFGKLALSLKGLKERDDMVFSFAKERQMKVVHAIGGGYNDDLERVVKAYVETFKAAKRANL